MIRLIRLATAIMLLERPSDGLGLTRPGRPGSARSPGRRRRVARSASVRRVGARRGRLSGGVGGFGLLGAAGGGRGRPAAARPWRRRDRPGPAPARERWSPDGRGRPGRRRAGRCGAELGPGSAPGPGSGGRAGGRVSGRRRVVAGRASVRRAGAGPGRVGARRAGPAVQRDRPGVAARLAADPAQDPAHRQHHQQDARARRQPHGDRAVGGRPHAQPARRAQQLAVRRCAPRPAR